MNEAERKEALADIRDPMRDEWPSELRDLPNDRYRQFALHYTANRNGAAAARAAGFGTPESTSETFARIAYRLLCDDRIVEAIGALAKRQVRSLAPLAVQAIKETLETSFHKDRLRGAEMVLTRTDNVTQKVAVEHTHHFDPVKVTLDEIVRLQAASASKEAIMLALGLQSDFEFSHYLNLLAKRQGTAPITAEYRELPPPETAPDPDDELLGVSHGEHDTN